MMNVTNLPVEVDAPLTLEERVTKLEAWAAKVTLAAHNTQYAKQGSPADKVGGRLSAAKEQS